MKFSIKETADLVTFTEEILNGKLHFLCSDCVSRLCVLCDKFTPCNVQSFFCFFFKKGVVYLF